MGLRAPPTSAPHTPRGQRSELSALFRRHSDRQKTVMSLQGPPRGTRAHTVANLGTRDCRPPPLALDLSLARSLSFCRSAVDGWSRMVGWCGNADAGPLIRSDSSTMCTFAHWRDGVSWRGSLNSVYLCNVSSATAGTRGGAGHSALQIFRFSVTTRFMWQRQSRA